MAKNQELELSILIGGRVDNSLAQAVKSANGQIGQLAKTISNVGKIGLGAMTGLAVGTTKFFADATKDAMKYESTMAEVAKVVDELKDDNGNFTVHFDRRVASIKGLLAHTQSASLRGRLNLIYRDTMQKYGRPTGPETDIWKGTYEEKKLARSVRKAA